MPEAFAAGCQAAKHPLATAWVLSVTFSRRRRGTGRQEERHVLGTIETVEDFWILHRRLVGPSNLPVGATLLLFREGIEPSWEAMPSGGTWMVHMERERVQPDVVDETWLCMAMAALGEQLLHDDGATDEVCGVRFGARRDACRCALWTCTTDDPATLHSFGRRLRALLPSEVGSDAASEHISYIPHADARRCEAEHRASLSTPPGVAKTKVSPSAPT